MFACHRDGSHFSILRWTMTFLSQHPIDDPAIVLVQHSMVWGVPKRLRLAPLDGHLHR
jgi:hypothetical protein